MATAQTPAPAHASPAAVEAISFTCPPLLGGSLKLQSNFKTTGNWDSGGAAPVVTCVFITSGGTIQPASLTVNTPPPNTWSATFNINAGTNGKLQATVKVNNVVTAQANVNNLQVVQNGGGTCN